MMGTAGTELLNTEFVMMKDTVWKLSSRVLLLEGFIKQQFGNVFWQFCEDQVKGGAGGEKSKLESGCDLDEQLEEEEEDSELKPFPQNHSHPLPMPPMIPILPKKAAIPPPPPTSNSTPPPPQSQLPSSTTPNSLSTRKTNSIPPPPPLSLMRGSSSYHAHSPHPHQTLKTRNFLPKSFTSTTTPSGVTIKKATPKLPPSITITPTSASKLGGNGRIPGGSGIFIEKISENSSHSEEQYQLQHQPNSKTRKSPAPASAPPPALVMSRSGRISSSSNLLNHNSSHTHNRGQSLLLQQHQFYSQEDPEEEEEDDYYEGQDHDQESGEYYSQEGGGDDGGGVGRESDPSEEEEDSEMYGDGGYLAAELVSATLCPPEEDELGDQEDYEDQDGDGMEGGVHKKIRLSLGAASSSSSYINGSNGSGSGGGSRQMRPNPCHARCQNRCHDIWTDGDRMGVFQTYWAIPNEEERREFVASRIERVDMATKRTEFSNFRTCTFKYYLPHPENAWVQVCKNFFLATIDEKRSYIEKIAQSVKGDAGTEKVSTKNIPFRRRNQMQRSVEDNYAGWMQGLGLDPSLLDVDPQGTGGGLMLGGYEGDEQDQEQDEHDGMEIMEDEASLQD